MLLQVWEKLRLLFSQENGYKVYAGCRDKNIENDGNINIYILMLQKTESIKKCSKKVIGYGG